MGKNADNSTKMKVNVRHVRKLPSILDEPQLAECSLALPKQEDCYLNLPNTSAVDSPLDIQTIHESQQEDTELLAHKEKQSKLYFGNKMR